MSLIDRLKSWLFVSRSGDAPASKTQRVARIFGRYDAATPSNDTDRHWAMADALDVNAAMSPGVRAEIRNRARYEIGNNSYARGIVKTVANDTIGSGPRLNVLVGTQEERRALEYEFGEWMREADIPNLLRMMREARISDGEVFGLQGTNERLAGPVKLTLRVIETDQCTSRAFDSSDTWRHYDGVILDRRGNISSYEFLNHHPGSMMPHTTKVRRVGVDRVIHFRRIERPGQLRAVSEMTPALNLFALLRQYTLATLGSAQIAAALSGVMYTDSPATDPEDGQAFEVLDIERNALMTLPAGWKIGQLKAEQPVTTYAEFKQALVNEILRCLLVPLNVGLGDSSKYNYASGRLDWQTYWRAIQVDRQLCDTQCMSKLFRWWLDEAVLISGLVPQVYRQAGRLPRHEWYWDGHQHIDPLKEATAQATRLSSGTTTLAAEYAAQGLDWAEALRQQIIEVEAYREAGLIHPLDAEMQNNATPPEEEEPAGG